MNNRRSWIFFGASLMGLAVLAGAFGAHALRDGLEATGQLENWRTAVRYQAWHGLGLLALAGYSQERQLPQRILWFMVSGTLLFSGSIYLLALELGSSVVGPITPVGGVLLLLAWGQVAWTASRDSGEPR